MEKHLHGAGNMHQIFSSRETLYVNPGIAESCFPVLSGKSKQCEYLLLGNTSPKVQLAILDQIETKPFIILDTFKLYIDTTLEDLKKNYASFRFVMY